MKKEKMISVEELIKLAKEKGVDFGRGNPYNRLRYYTKINWLPYMVRKKNSSGKTVGHYPISILNRLMYIQKLKNKGLTNEQIDKNIKRRDKLRNILNTTSLKNINNNYLSFMIFVLVFILLFIQVKSLNSSNNLEKLSSSILTNNELGMIKESGFGIISRGSDSATIKSKNIDESSKVYIVFTTNYSPATRYWVEINKEKNEFEVKLDSKVFKDTTFQWWVTN